MGEIRVGTASWTDKTLLESGWYPEGVDSAADRLAYYASRFPLVEVDSTYYTPPNERNSELWAQRTPPGFLFNIKAYGLLTQHPVRPASLYKDLRPAGETKKNLYAKDLDDKTVDEVWQRFLSALDPLHEAGKLGSVLFQFPQWFPIGTRNKEYILESKERCWPMRIAVEFRNRTWMSEENREETLEFLRDYQVPYVSVDMPQGHASSIPPIAAATSDLAVVRFHGRTDTWASKDIHERFGYLYSRDELAEWVPKIRDLAANAEQVHVLMNNCYRDYAQVNAEQLAGLVGSPGPAHPAEAR
jgi:uncharacterized protein YecE (DUF72 family)